MISWRHAIRTMVWLAVAFCLFGPSPVVAAVADAEPLPEVAFDTNGTIHSTEGHATLSWAAQETNGPIRTFELQYSDRADFASARTWYRGPDRASFVSGLPAGKTWFRVRVVEDGRAGPFSQPIAIDVQYAAPTTVVSLMTLGTIVFLATVATVVVGHRRRNVALR